MGATREAIMEALLAVLSQAGAFQTVGRRLVDPEGLKTAQSPALFLIAHEDLFERKQPGYNLPPKREIHALAIIYNDVGADPAAIPEQFINNALDTLDGLFVPDNRATNTFTLGGLVQSCAIDGKSVRGSGDMTGKALVSIPIHILIP